MKLEQIEQGREAGTRPIPQGYGRGGRGYRLLLVALFAAGVVTFAQLYAPQGILTLIQAEPGWRLTTSRSSLVISVATFSLAASVLLWAFMAKRMGTYRVMCASVIISTVTGVLSAAAPTFGLLIAIRIVQGFGAAGMAALAVSYIVERVRGRDVPVAAGIYVAGTTIGGLSGRVLAAAVGDMAGWRVAMCVVAGLSLVCGIVFVIAGFSSRRGTAGPQEESRETPQGDAPVRGMGGFLKRPETLAFYLLIFVLMGSLVAMYNYFGFHLAGPGFNLGPGAVGFFYFAYLGGTIGASVAGSAASRYGIGKSLSTSVAVMLAGTLLMAAQHLAVFAVGLICFTTAFFAAHAVASAWVAQAAGRRGSGTASALYSLSYYGGSAVLGWLGGVVYEHAGWNFFIGSVLGCCALAGLTAWVLLKYGQGRGARADRMQEAEAGQS